MGSADLWCMFAILCQTFIAVVVSYTVLTCKLCPYKDELYEVTIAKLLYLYDPIACDKTHFYNYTVLENSGNGVFSSLYWPDDNHVATSFRRKISIWLSLHLIWSALGLVNLIQRQRLCGFYVTIIPFTATGVAILVLDLLYAVLFYVDATNTGTEMDILQYIDSGKKDSQTISSRTISSQYDTSWVALLLAYCSVRGVVPWFINFWIVKDMYFDGLASHHRMRANYMIRKPLNSDDSIDTNV